MAQRVLGLDIGGANLKAAHTDGSARLVPFPLWKAPQRLAEELRRLTASMPRFDLLAVTMTGELCDCYESKRQGVQAILDAVESAAPGAATLVWRNDARFVDVHTARQSPLQVAAANWLALATYAGRFTPEGSALLLDIGSTTTDIVPLLNGKPVPFGRTDPERLRCHELIYTGVRRTPLCALLGPEGAAELFASTLDAYLVLDAIAEDGKDCDTADGRPATKAAAHLRLARMICADLETSTESERRKLALRAMQRQTYYLATGLELVTRRMAAPPRFVVTSGSGEFLARGVLETQTAVQSPGVVSLAAELGATPSRAACARAIAVLAEEQADGTVP
jgi:(4-(4-[2-(gamma-L-glutamylamino)ethyl]phenoxymethyl)furan-2-yl)methanamine synthase